MDFSRVEEMRAARIRCAALTCHEAEAIFGVIAPLIADGATDVQKKHAIALAIQAAAATWHARRHDKDAPVDRAAGARLQNWC